MIFSFGILPHKGRNGIDKVSQCVIQIEGARVVINVVAQVVHRLLQKFEDVHYCLNKVETLSMSAQHILLLAFSPDYDYF